MSEDKPRPTGAGDLDEPSDSRDEAQSSVVAELPQFRSERLLVGSFVYGWIWPAAAKEWVRNSVITSAAVTLTLTIMLTHLPAAVLSATLGPSQPPPSFWNAVLQAESIIATLAVSYGIWSLNITYHRLFDNEMHQTLSPFSVNQGAIDAVRRSHDALLSVWRQLVVFAAFGTLAVISLVFLDIVSGLSYWFGDYVHAFILAGVAGYYMRFGRIIPRLARIGFEHKLPVDWARPQGSPWIKSASAALGSFALFGGLGVSLVMLGLIFVRRWNDQVVTQVSTAWFIIGIAALATLICYTLFYLNRAIAAERQGNLATIRERLGAYQGRLDSLERDELAEASNLLNLEVRIAESRYRPLILIGFNRSLASLAIPVATYIAKAVHAQDLVVRYIFQ